MGTYGKDSRALKMEIMRKHYDEGKTINNLAREYNISTQTIYGWRSAYQRFGDSAFVGCGHSRTWEKEIAELRAEIERLRGLLAQ
jgi:transposase-like protein